MGFLSASIIGNTKKAIDDKLATLGETETSA